MDTRILAVAGCVVGGGLLLFANCIDATHSTHKRAGTAIIEAAAGAAVSQPDARLEFRLFECGGAEPVARLQTPFEAGSLAEFRRFAPMKIRASLDHGFADARWRLAAGCYQVGARVVDAAGEPVAECDEARSPETVLGRGQHQSFVLLADCRAAAGEGVEVAGVVNHAPEIVDVHVQKTGSEQCAPVDVCVTVADRDDDATVLSWSAGPRQSGTLDLPAPSLDADPTRRTVCVPVVPERGVEAFEATLRDRRRRGSKLVAVEDLRFGERGLVSASRDTASAPLPRGCNELRCPLAADDRITNLTYWITRDGALLAPTRDLSQVRGGDTVDVEFDVAPGCESVPVTFASYSLDDQGNRSVAASVFTGRFDAGAHMLWNVVPECGFRVDLHLGEPLDAASLPPGQNPYAERLIDTTARGRDACAGAGAD